MDERGEVKPSASFTASADISASGRLETAFQIDSFFTPGFSVGQEYGCAKCQQKND